MMASWTLNFFQCLVCEKLVADFWKAQKHLQKHETEENSNKNKSNDVPRRRGMLPIRKVTFYECYIPVVKNQIDPAFLEQYDNRVEALEDCEPVSKVRNGYDAKGKTDESRFPSSRLRPIRGKAVAAQRKLLSAVNDDNDSDEEDDDALDDTSITSESSNSDEDDFHPDDDPNQKKGPKRRRRRRRKGLINEVKTENGKNVLRCEYCSDDFPGKPTLNRHIEKKHRDVAQLIYCPIPMCNQPAINNPAMLCHIKCHLEAERTLQLFSEATRSGPKMKPKKLKKIRCKYCLSPHKSINLLRNHVKTVHRNCTLKCPSCDKMFGDCLVEMLSHIKLNHPSIVDPYDERLKRRIAMQDLKNRYKCDQCEKSFAFVSKLNEHVLSHKKKEAEPSQEYLVERPYPCPVCQKRFKHKDNLKRHFTLHLENNPFVCDIDNCNRKFNSDYNLRRHKLLHYDGSVQAEAYRETCPICHLSLSGRDKLIRHLRVVHKPEDVANGGPVLTKKSLRMVRLPRIRGPSIFTIMSSSKTTTKPEPPEISDTGAIEQNSSAFVALTPPVPEKLKIEALPEIHLVDKVVIGSDGTAMHIKGENLSPQKIPITETPPSVSQELPLAVNDVGLNKLLYQDPIYKKLYFSNPDSVKPIYSRPHNYGTGKTFTCEECHARFSRAWTLQLHLKTIHNKTILDQTMESPSDRPTLHPESDQSQHQVTLMCGRCAHVAKNAKDLEKHMTAPTHQPSMDRRHRCHVCGVGCSTLKRLHEHTILIHNRARKHICRFCKKAFATLAHVKTHELRVHDNSTGVKKKRCPICTNYLTAASFNVHVKRHATRNDDEALKCQLCGDTFACRSSLRRHIDCIHLGKPLNQNQRKKPRSAQNNTTDAGGPAGTPLKRGPKRTDPTPDWIESLLATLDGHQQNDSKCVRTELDTNKPAKHSHLEQPVTASEKTRDSAAGDEEVSILGF